ncbi:MAG: TonB-dependent hemoglobin/transferrin/lactoferrin family receptor, partial [Steroidobacter sp.]
MTDINRSPFNPGVLLLLVAGSPCAAETDAPTAKPTIVNASPLVIQELKKISVTATRGERQIDTIAGTVTIIDEAQIAAQMSNDIKDLIRYEPGVSAANGPTRFGLAGFNIRGVDGNRVLLRVDDVRMGDAFSIGSFADARRNLIDLDSVKSVEIIRGAASALYGSDAIGGVVSFVLKDPEDYLEPARNRFSSIKSGYQSDDGGLLLGGTLALGGDSLSALFNYTRRSGDERENQGEIDVASRARTAPNPQECESDSALAKLNWRPNDDNTFQLTLAADRSDVDTDVLSGVGVSGAGVLAVNTLGLRGDDRQERNRISVRHEWLTPTALFDSLEWRVHAQNTDIEQRTLERRHSAAAGPAATVQRDRTFTFEQASLGGEIILHKEFAGERTGHHLTYGVEAIGTWTEQMRNGLQTNVATGAQTATVLPDVFPVRDFPKTDTQQVAFFVQDEISLGEGVWIITPGVRVDDYRLDPKPDEIFVADNPGVGVAEIHETSVSPKLGVVWAFGEQLSAFAHYARGFRAPPYNDVNIGFTNLAFGYTAIANPDLKPETSDSSELGLRGDFGDSFLALAAFHNDYSDFIESLSFVGVVNGLQVFQSQNLSKARIHGVEVRGGLDLTAVSPHLEGWRLRSSIAYARGDDRITDEPLNSVDPLKGVLGIAYEPEHRGWSVELIATAVDRKSRIDES